MYIHVYKEDTSSFNPFRKKFTNSLLNIPIVFKEPSRNQKIIYPNHKDFEDCVHNNVMLDALGFTDDDYYASKSWGKEINHIHEDCFRIVQKMEMVKPIILVRVKPNRHKIWRNFIGFTLQVLVPRHEIHFENNYELNHSLFFSEFVENQCPRRVVDTGFGSTRTFIDHEPYKRLRALHNYTDYLYYVPKKIVDIVSPAEMFQNKLIEQGKGEVLI
ncbi:hypothetical protein_gp200 [Bacillus phage vB_BceM_WH1]|nr:hypothetical protein_gp200 [Bacillus phage vB_BceM_WH1]